MLDDIHTLHPHQPWRVVSKGEPPVPLLLVPFPISSLVLTTRALLLQQIIKLDIYVSARRVVALTGAEEEHLLSEKRHPQSYCGALVCKVKKEYDQVVVVVYESVSELYMHRQIVFFFFLWGSLFTTTGQLNMLYLPHQSYL